MKHWYDAPIVEDFKALDVVSPKEVVQKALGDFSVLIDAVAATLMEIKTYMCTDDTIDVSDGVILPILMIENMRNSDIEGFNKVIASKLEDLDRLAARGELRLYGRQA
ncbi:hypothetical protein GCG54_00006326 [Colletotrichum gloeosporioides]|uniref:Uncharacterized protein n=1 Tax=Colletotrichum gloeosporioides TaxID=474922 RepID=A0A8H4CQW1_COLGL|nr:uncharacterized protein GCG54_00006326 [Colletotrichum gloeosporioides]KAF3808466.1 hypothetical protein GCG54_00006326 [Colletotrichum gloeosporioides]